MCQSAVRSGNDIVLEPSFGAGSFLDAASKRLLSLGGSCRQVFGVEIDPVPVAGYREKGVLPSENLILSDFLSVKPFPVTVVVGNPPYVRLRNLEASARERALSLASRAGVPVDPAGSLWYPFVVHCCSFLRPGGRMALVLPYEMTYVRYAIPLWDYLCRSFGRITISRVRERVFPAIQEDVVFLEAEDFGQKSSSVRFRAYLQLEDLEAGKPVRQADIPLEEILAANKPFAWALVDGSLAETVKSLVLSGGLIPAGREIKFKTGYVSGDKDFFHPDARTLREFGIPDANTRPAITKSSRLKGLSTSTAGPDAVLYYPKELTPGDRAYISYGESIGVHLKYKCRSREPWYVVPGVEVPDLVLTTFADTPILAVNQKGCVASNSLLCGFLRDKTADPFAILARWYMPLTLLSIEIEVHSLGGGLLILIPGEAEKILMAAPGAQRPSRQTGSMAESAGGISAYLENQLKMPGAPNLQAVLDAISTLRSWRQRRTQGIECPAMVQSAG